MDCPELYVKNNNLQRRNVENILRKYVERLLWKPNDIVLDIGCGPGDVTSGILYPILQDKIIQLIGVDKSKRMVDYAKKTYGCSKIDFKILDIENADDCILYSQNFNRVFSFFCLHWAHDKLNAFVNVHSMLKSGGEILITFLLVNPFVEWYTYLDEEWQQYIGNMKNASLNVYTQEEIKTFFINAGFQVISVESSLKKFTYPDLSSLLNAMKLVDGMYDVLPSHLHSSYFLHFKDILIKKKLVEICPITGKTTEAYLPITVHAIKN